MQTASQQSGLRECSAYALATKVAAFNADERGNIAIVFGLTIGAICMLMGAAVDYARFTNARMQTLAAMDTAVLSAGRALQTGATSATAIAQAKKVYTTNIKQRITVLKDTVAFEVINDGANVTGKGSVEINTPFLGFMRIPKMQLLGNVKGKEETVEATIAQDRFIGVNKEVSLMLDVSGSMCSPCSKLDTMKQAARDLVDTMMRNNGKSDFKTRIALVPFSADVRPPQAWLASIRDPADTPATRTKSVSTKYGTQTYTYTLSRCVAERKGDQKYTKAAPGPNAYVMGAYSDSSSNNYCATPATGEVVPLSDSPDTLKTKITNLTKGGGTAGHVGTAWAYYMLSPTWNSVIPAANQPSAYGTKDLRKIAILMTDGEYNFQYDSQGVSTSDSGAGTSANGKTSAQQAVSICTNMKADNIEVFTVGFDLGGNQTAINTLSSCATDASHFYNAEDNAALLAAFRDISIKLTDLHLSK